MPAALEVDREKVRIVALNVGVREAARQFELNEDTVSAWSAREGWFREKEKEQEIVQEALWRKQQSQGISQAAASKSASEVLKGYDGQTRMGLARGLAAGADHVSTLDGQEILMASQQISHLAKSAALVHGWAQNVTHSMSLEAIAGTVINQDALPECPEMD